MMEGIEILAQEPIMGGGCGDIALAIGLIVAVIVGIIVGIYYIDAASGVFAGILVMLITVVAGMFTEAFTAHPTGEYKYKVTISDDVSMNEFLEKYEIVDQEGKIMTIKERDEAND